MGVPQEGSIHEAGAVGGEVRAVVGLGAGRGLQAEVFQNRQCVRSPGSKPRAA